MLKEVVLVFLFLIYVLGVANGDYQKIIHNTDPQAKCLDGSPAMIYVHEGGDTKNIVFHLIGGGVCVGLDL